MDDLFTEVLNKRLQLSFCWVFLIFFLSPINKSSFTSITMKQQRKIYITTWPNKTKTISMDKNMCYSYLGEVALSDPFRTGNAEAVMNS